MALQNDLPWALLRVFSCSALLLLSCGSPQTAPVPDTHTAPPPTTAGDVVVPRSAKGRAPLMDRSTPDNVLASIKDIIATDALDSMKRFCLTEGTLSGPAYLLCNIATENMDQIDKFRQWFANARIDSAALVHGDTALLPLTLSPGHENLERHGFLVMVRNNGSWYLEDMDWKR